LNRDALALYAKINKDMGESTAARGSELRLVNRKPTGSLAFDVALGGGWPGLHWSEVIGYESHGKSAVVLKTVAANQALDPDFTTLWMASEHYDVAQAEALGVDNSRVIVVSSQATEFVYETILAYARSQSVDLIVLDSYPALIPDEEDAKTMDDFVVGVGARLTGKFFRKIAKEFRRTEDERQIFGLFVNQWRADIGKYSPQGTPKTTPGGNAKNYAFYARVEVARTDYIDESRPGKGKVKVGQEIKIKTIKNKSAAPQQVAYVDFYFREAPYLGFKRGDYDTAKEIFTLGIVYDIIVRRGAYFDFGGQSYNGKNAAFKALRDDPALAETIRQEILDAARRPDQILRQVTDEDLAVAEATGTKKVTRRKRTAKGAASGPADLTNAQADALAATAMK
jgi:recombination protein RecA